MVEAPAAFGLLSQGSALDPLRKTRCEPDLGPSRGRRNVGEQWLFGLERSAHAAGLPPAQR